MKDRCDVFTWNVCAPIQDGEEARLPRSIAEDIFKRDAVSFDPSCGLVEWIDGEAEIDFGDEETLFVVYCARFMGLTYLELDPVVVNSARDMIDLMDVQWVNPAPHHRLA